MLVLELVVGISLLHTYGVLLEGTYMDYLLHHRQQLVINNHQWLFGITNVTTVWFLNGVQI